MAPNAPKRKIDVVDLTQSSDAEDSFESSLGSQPRKAPRAAEAASQASKNSHPVYRPSATQPSGRYSPNKAGQRYAGQSKAPYATPPSSSQQSPGQSFSHSSYAQAPYTPNPGIITGKKTYEDASTRNNWMDEEEVRGEIDLTLDEDDDDAYHDFELYGIFNTKIVGVRYYTGRATLGEYVVVKREPRNPYDSNAIRISNVMGDQIGHLNRQTAARLAPLMDSKALLIEGALTGPKGTYDCPIGLKLFGTRDPVAGAALKQQMIALNLPVAEHNRAEAERKRKQKEREEALKEARKANSNSLRKGTNTMQIDAGSSRYANLNMPGAGEPTQSLAQVMETAQNYNPREVQDVVNKFGAGEDVLSAMPMADQPARLKTQLLPYQRQGLKWMQSKESCTLPPTTSSDVVQLWKRQQNGYLNIATNFFTGSAPTLAKGGILADDMGLGKTIQVISLIMSDDFRAGRPTLIVAPLSVMSNWSTQAERHVQPDHLPKVLIYHGASKGDLKEADFAKYDIVITTYQTMALELFPYGASKPIHTPAAKGLFSTSWRRIVLDEGHQIRNPKAKMAQAACAIRADARWILTGTPIVNNLKDLYSHVKFLRLTGGLEQLDIFNGTLIRPLKSGDPNATVLLQALMSTICLRRMKDMKFIDLRLPELVSHKYPIKFHSHEREKYDAFSAQAKGLVDQMKHNEGNNKTFTNLLEVLLRMRQCCNHWKLCGEDRVNRILALVEENKVVDVQNQANRRALQDVLQLKIDSQEECPICMDSFKDPMITACAHVFCNGCVERVIQEQHKCPMCRNELPDITSLVPPAAGFGEGDNEEEIDIDPNITSSKIEALIKILKASQNAKDTKTVVFSQWTSFLDVVQTQLQTHNLPFTRLDGKMPASRRDTAIRALDTDPDCKIMLASLSVCSVGLNLVSANQVILADSWWAPAIEDQAVDRVHRLGQKRKCTVMRLVMEGSVEEEVLEVQARKRKLMGQAFGEEEGRGRKRRGEERSGRLRDIEQLLR
ncbi:hypothetical protein EPUS_05257 [Endocarpon pusillum Z07020]|uniref:Uncharacterized protein n=1 Tax=Endocarpon pusillum (strain Z07020 / HMAS-L-300199) TaxID=1263415 RepID=U1G933_ENDPU|nr:uncharacterized protein EPUS_05257 [Endocarpon pusillum Z07020]ERF68176.1 hypothetical protein EPUS_05257 [Endocarpon pusillum Z07020]